MLRKEKTSIRLEPGLLKWLRRRANERHITLSAAIEDCVRREKDNEYLELLVRACLEGVARILAGDSAGLENVRKVKVCLVRVAKEEVMRSGQGSSHKGS